MKKISGDVVHKEDMKVIGKEISERLKKLCNSKSMSLQGLSSLSKVPYARLKQIESGEEIYTIKQAKLVSSALGVTPQYLICGED